MFEANAGNEFTMNILKDIYSEMLANGRPSPAKLRNAMSSIETWDTIKALGMIPEDK
jgi:hypothetical protein